MQMATLIMYALTRLFTGFEGFEDPIESAYLFLQNFDSPKHKVVNDIVNRVFEVLYENS